MRLPDRNSDCVFCAPGGEDDVHTNELAFVRRDGYPLTDGHSLVVPRRHVASFFELTWRERTAVLELFEQAKAGLDKTYHPMVTTTASMTARRQGKR